MKYLTTAEMREISDNMAEFMYIRTENGVDVRKKCTKTQKGILSNVIFSALSTAVWHSKTPSVEIKKQAVCDMAEIFITLAFPDCNGYTTVYNPLKRLFDVLETETE